jgi:HPt (histidine-containing phosphotransfer) domain-containing protein
MKMEVNISRIEDIVGDDNEMKKTLLEMFLRSCDKSIDALDKSLILQGDEAKKAWHDINHDLKGAAYNLGFTDLGDHCKKVENADLSVDEKKKTIAEYRVAREDVSNILKSL